MLPLFTRRQVKRSAAFAYKRKATNKDKQDTWLACKACNRLVDLTLFQVLQQTFLICTTRTTRTNCQTNLITAVYQLLVLHYLIRIFGTATKRFVSRRTPRLCPTCHLVETSNRPLYKQLLCIVADVEQNGSTGFLWLQNTNSVHR